MADLGCDWFLADALPPPPAPAPANASAAPRLTPREGVDEVVAAPPPAPRTGTDRVNRTRSSSRRIAMLSLRGRTNSFSSNTMGAPWVFALPPPPPPPSARSSSESGASRSNRSRNATARSPMVSKEGFSNIQLLVVASPPPSTARSRSACSLIRTTIVGNCCWNQVKCSWSSGKGLLWTETSGSSSYLAKNTRFVARGERIELSVAHACAK